MRSDAGRDAGATVPDANAVDAGRDTGTVTPSTLFRCGPVTPSLSCDSRTETCCATFSTGGRTTYSCESFGDCDASSVALECATSADCKNGDVCCGFSTAGSWYSVECTRTCENTGQFEANAMCAPGTPSACSGGGVCQASRVLPGYGYCNN